MSTWFPSTWRARAPRPLRAGPVALLACALAACSTPPPAQPEVPPLTDATPEQMVAIIRATAGDGDNELAVQPLRDPRVEDLRDSAQRLEAQKHYADAAQMLDQALAIAADDPALLQERAEITLLLQDPAAAGAMAHKAYEAGAKVGPLCRRHWATIEQARLKTGDAPGAAAAKAQVEACTLAAPARF